MKGDRIRLVQVGVGRWGHHLLRNFLALSAVEVVAVVEQPTVDYQTLREKFELSPAVELTADFEIAVAREDVDAVAIATPAHTHYDLIKLALKHGKHVLAEKPLALSVAECEELCALARQQNCQLVVDHTYLFHPVVQTAQAVLVHQPLGPLRYGYATRTNLGPVRPDVDALWDLAIHDIAIFNAWLGQSPITVVAQGQGWLPHHCDPAATKRVDAAWLRLIYADGFQATIHVSWANADKQRRLCVVGDRGTLIFDEMQTTAPLTVQHGFFTEQQRQFFPAGPDREDLFVQAKEPLAQVCEHFVQCAMTNQLSVVSSGLVGTDLVKILAALSHSLVHDGQQVSLI